MATESADHPGNVWCCRSMPDGDRVLQGQMQVHPPRRNNAERAQVQHRVYDRDPRVSAAASSLGTAAQALSSLDAYSRSFILDSRGINPLNHQDSKIDALWDQLKAAPTAEESSRLSREVQRYIVHNMVPITATTLPFIQAARDSVKGYVYERGLKIRFERT
jgi:hypothetical protein